MMAVPPALMAPELVNVTEPPALIATPLAASASIEPPALLVIVAAPVALMPNALATIVPVFEVTLTVWPRTAVPPASTSPALARLTVLARILSELPMAMPLTPIAWIVPPVLTIVSAGGIDAERAADDRSGVRGEVDGVGERGDIGGADGNAVGAGRLDRASGIVGNGCGAADQYAECVTRDS